MKHNQAPKHCSTFMWISSGTIRREGLLRQGELHFQRFWFILSKSPHKANGSADLPQECLFVFKRQPQDRATGEKYLAIYVSNKGLSVFYLFF